MLRQSNPIVGLLRVFASSALAVFCIFVLYSFVSYSSSFQSLPAVFPISHYRFNKRTTSVFNVFNSGNMGKAYSKEARKPRSKSTYLDEIRSGSDVKMQGPVYKRASLLLNPTYLIPPTFLLDKSTEENYGVDNMDFIGPFESVRANLDYSYHGNYIKSRQLFQDRIVEKMLDGTIIEDSNGRGVCRTPTEPWIVFTAGVMGAGKSHTIKQLSDRGLFPLQSYVVVDPDEIRQHFPEYCLYAMESPKHAGELTHKEAGYVTEIVTAAALQRGYNVLVDGSLWDVDWYKSYFDHLKESYGNLRIAILHVTAPREAVFERAKHRAEVTGRVVPIETLELSLKHVPQSIKILRHLVDYFCELDNSPYSEEVTIKTEGVSCDSFRDNWAQVCPLPSKGKM